MQFYVVAPSNSCNSSQKGKEEGVKRDFVESVYGTLEARKPLVG